MPYFCPSSKGLYNVFLSSFFWLLQRTSFFTRFVWRLFFYLFVLSPPPSAANADESRRRLIFLLKFQPKPDVQSKIKDFWGQTLNCRNEVLFRCISAVKCSEVLKRSGKTEVSLACLISSRARGGGQCPRRVSSYHPIHPCSSFDVTQSKDALAEVVVDMDVEDGVNGAGLCARTIPFADVLRKPQPVRPSVASARSLQSDSSNPVK